MVFCRRWQARMEQEMIKVLNTTALVTLLRDSWLYDRRARLSNAALVDAPIA